jgi:hypothetical protein
LFCVYLSHPGTLTESYDELGNRYQLPAYTLAPPTNLINECTNESQALNLKEQKKPPPPPKEEFQLRVRLSCGKRDTLFLFSFVVFLFNFSLGFFIEIRGVYYESRSMYSGFSEMSYLQLTSHSSSVFIHVTKVNIDQTPAYILSLPACVFMSHMTSCKSIHGGVSATFSFLPKSK